jgi:hypothetical protein
MKMLPVWNERSGRQKEEAVERDKQAGTHRDGGDALAVVLFAPALVPRRAS